MTPHPITAKCDHFLSFPSQTSNPEAGLSLRSSASARPGSIRAQTLFFRGSLKTHSVTQHTHPKPQKWGTGFCPMLRGYDLRKGLLKTLGAGPLWDASSETGKGRTKGNSVRGALCLRSSWSWSSESDSNEDSVNAESGHTATRQQQTL